MTNEKNLNYVSKEFAQLNTPKTYEQFVLEEQQNPSQEQNIVDSYEAEFDACSSIGTSKVYGPCPEQYYSDSSGNYVRITVTSEKEVKKKAWEEGLAAYHNYISNKWYRAWDRWETNPEIKNNTYRGAVGESQWEEGYRFGSNYPKSAGSYRLKYAPKLSMNETFDLNYALKSNPYA